jgi:hypothetical protein
MTDRKLSLDFISSVLSENGTLRLLRERIGLLVPSSSGLYDQRSDTYDDIEETRQSY